jgi:uncharacterized protein
METKSDRLIIFVKWPEKGKVKTRLTAALGEDAAYELYKCFVEDLFNTVVLTGIRPLIAFHPEGAEDRIRAWLGSGYNYIPQVGSDLGERMKNAFSQVFSDGVSQAVLIGSDFPDLPAAIINDAFSSLKRNDTVIGPARDGGYYLIGFRRKTFLPGIFDAIPWSTNIVFARTMAILRKEGSRIHQLPVWNDIDRPGDLAGLIERNMNNNSACPRTLSCLMRHGIYDDLCAETEK